MKHLFAILALVAAAHTALAQTRPVADMAKFENQLKTTAEKLKSIESDFTQVKHLDMFDEDVTSKGRFYYLKDNKISLDYSKPLSYLIVINGSRLKIVADGKKSVMQLNTNKMMNEMQDMITACMVGDLSRMNNNYELKYQEDDRQYIVSITPRSKTVKEYVSGIDDYTDYRFTNKRFNQITDESRFKID